MKDETSWGQVEQLLTVGLLLNHSPLERIPSGVQPTSNSPGHPACSAMSIHRGKGSYRDAKKLNPFSNLISSCCRLFLSVIKMSHYLST